MRKKILLVGNDINNVTESYSWSELIKGLMKKARIDSHIAARDKPFPLLYEEIYLNSARLFNTPEKELKAFIASQTKELENNELHEEILDLGIENIFTTNYDLSFEFSRGINLKKLTNKGIIKESVYSLFRYHDIGSHKIWHIHGSQTSPRTINLGYEQYSGYLQQMRNYVTSGTKGTYAAKDFQPLSKRLRDGEVKHESWIDFFFTHDVYILGLNLDFVEMHLWWLLTYRARAVVEGKFPVENKIVYFYPSKYESTSQNKLEMFRANGVETISKSLRADNKLAYYRKVIDSIR